MNFELTRNYPINISIDFNEVVRLVCSNHLNHSFSSKIDKDYVLNSTVQVKKIEQDKKYHELFNILNKEHNPNNLRSDLSIFFSMNSGTSGYLHADNDLQEVHIIGVLGHTVYLVDGNTFEIIPGSKLFIKGGIMHKSISLSPRIILSYAIYKEVE